MLELHELGEMLPAVVMNKSGVVEPLSELV